MTTLTVKDEFSLAEDDFVRTKLPRTSFQRGRNSRGRNCQNGGVQSVLLCEGVFVWGWIGQYPIWNSVFARTECRDTAASNDSVIGPTLSMLMKLETFFNVHKVTEKIHDKKVNTVFTPKLSSCDNRVVLKSWHINGFLIYSTLMTDRWQREPGRPPLFEKSCYYYYYYNTVYFKQHRMYNVEKRVHF